MPDSTAQPFRTDTHRNPTAFTTDIARQAGLIIGVDYTRGDRFSPGEGLRDLHTARLLRDPIETTIRVIDKIGFYTKTGAQRWDYIPSPTAMQFLWSLLTPEQKKSVIGFMYKNEGGTAMLGLFT